MHCLTIRTTFTKLSPWQQSPWALLPWSLTPSILGFRQGLEIEKKDTYASNLIQLNAGGKIETANNYDQPINGTHGHHSNNSTNQNSTHSYAVILSAELLQTAV